MCIYNYNSKYDTNKIINDKIELYDFKVGFVLILNLENWKPVCNIFCHYILLWFRYFDPYMYTSFVIKEKEFNPMFSCPNYWDRDFTSSIENVQQQYIKKMSQINKPTFESEKTEIY